MKILALRLANLASIPGPVEFDFSKPPLCDAGLFAITGPTGAGKSTLLDALCLALYGSTPRLRQAPTRDAQLPDVGVETLNTADARTLLRRGTSSGYAEVDFLGRDGHRYRAHWSVRRARSKAGGKLQAVEQSLTDLEDGRILTAQKREFDRLLPERLGLSFDQFTRAVLLAQSEFAAFLKADDNERSELLEKLTDTAEYSAISKAVYRRASQAKKRVDALETRLADDLPADPETRITLEKNAEAAQNELNLLQQKADEFKARKQWHATDVALKKAYLEGCQHQRNAKNRWQTLADIRADQEWRRLISSQRHRLSRQLELPREIASLEMIHAETNRARHDAETALQTATKRQDQTEQSLVEADKARQHAEPELYKARKQAQAQATLEYQLTDLEIRHQQRQRQASQLAEQRRQIEEKQHELKRQHDEWQATLQQHLGHHAQLDSARYAAQQEHDRFAWRHLALGELESRWQEARRADQAHQALTQCLNADANRKIALVKQGHVARQQQDERERHYRTVQDVIERGRVVRSESVATLRERLKENEACPVCGGLDHPWRNNPPETPEATQLKAQQAEEDRQLAQALAEWEQAQQERQALASQYQAVEASLNQQRKDLDNADQRLTAARQDLADHPLYAEFVAVSIGERGAWLAHQRQVSNAARQHQAQTLQALAQAEAELAPLEKTLRKNELELTQCKAQHISVEEELTSLSQAIPPLRQQHDTTTIELKALLGEYPTADAWQQRLDTHQKSARQQRDAALKQLHAASSQQQRLTQQAAHEAQQIARLHQERNVLDRELAQWRQDYPALNDATLYRLLAQPEDEASRQERQLLEAEEARQRTIASLNERRQALIAHRRNQNLTAGHSESETREKTSEQDDEPLLSENSEIEIQYQHKAITDEQNALIPQLTTAQQTRDEAVHTLRDDDRRRERQRQGQTEREAARTEYRRWGQINELIGAADGKTFRRIAQAWNLERLLEEANAHLIGLSRRYRLERGGSELGLLVMDKDMGDERRSVHSLSGGETFLVSLALALGLASMASGQLAIESLFIDEGFGSLDPQSLALAMEALDGLQAQGRRVGVISHVQEMHERIPVQIKVEPMGNGTSRARLVNG